jgi:competence protein ComEC
MLQIRTAMIVLLLTVGGSVVAQDKMYVHIINVGQGSAALIEFPCGVMLLDTGGESNDLFQSTEALMNYLNDFYSRRQDLNNTIDLLVISHPHIDHTRGIKELVSKYRIKNLVTNGETKKGSGIAGQQFIQRMAAQSEGTPSSDDDINFFASSIDKISDGGVTSNVIDPINCPGADPIIKLLWGSMHTNPGLTKADFENQNNHSVVCKIDFGQASIILTGDLEDVVIPSLLSKHSDKRVFDSDVYLVGHHGSKNGTTVPFLQVATPEIAILSFGDNSRELPWTAWAYGHPNKGIVQMLMNSVTGSRTPKNAFVGNGAKSFTNRQVSKAIYGVGWDNSFVLNGSMNGDWTYGFVSGETTADNRININKATEAELQTLPSIGAVRAKAIVKYRDTLAFTNLEELDNVDGIGPATINLLRTLIKFSP